MHKKNIFKKQTCTHFLNVLFIRVEHFNACDDFFIFVGYFFLSATAGAVVEVLTDSTHVRGKLFVSALRIELH